MSTSKERRTVMSIDTNVKTNNKKIELLELLRIFAMTVVFLDHYLSDLVRSGAGFSWYVDGKFGVAFFFMIFAYLMAKTYKYNGIGFLKDKLVQLVPKYWIVLFFIFIGSIFLPGSFRTIDLSAGNWIKSFFLFPFTTPGVPYVCPILPVAWTLIVQISVIVVFWIVSTVTKDKEKTTLFLVMLNVVLYIFGQVVGENYNLFTFTFCRFYVLYFAAGFTIALIESKVSDKKAISECQLNLVLMLVCLVLFVVLAYFYKEELLFYIINILFFATIILFCQKIRVPNYVLTIAKHSYSFYLIHYLVCKVFSRIVIRSNSARDYLLFLIPCYVLTVFSAFIFDAVYDILMARIRKK